MRQINLKEMYDAGVHLGSKIKSLNPKMKPYVMCTHDELTIIDILKTYTRLFRITLFLKRTIATENSRILFVGTKRSIVPIVTEMAIKSSSYCITERWKGGLLTNFKTVKIQKPTFQSTDLSVTSNLNIENNSLISLNSELTNSLENKSLTDKSTQEEQESLNQNSLETTNFKPHDLTDLPDLVIIIDQGRELKAVKECQKLNIPILTILDTDGDPDKTNLFIPANDDSFLSIEYILKHLAQAILIGRLLYDKNNEIKN